MYLRRPRQHPAQRHTQHRAPDGCALRRGAVRRRGLHRPQLAPLPPRRRRRGRTRSRPVRRIQLEAADDDLHRHRLTKTGGARAARRRDHRPGPAVLQQRRGVRGRPPGGGDAGGPVLPQRRSPTRCCSSTRAAGVCDTIFGPLRYGPGDYLVLPIGTTWRLDPDAGSAQRMLYLEAPSEIEPPKRYRNDYGQLLEHAPYSQRDLHAPGARRAPDATRATSSSTSDRADRITAYHYRHHPFDVVGWDGYLWPFRVQHRRLPADHRAGPPAAAGPPDVPGPELRRLLVRAPQVRLPPARDPGAVQPLEHQQRRGHLLRGRQLHEPARGGDRVVHAPPGRDSPRPAPGHGRGVDRQGGDRGAGGHGRHVPPAPDHEGGDGPRRRPLPVQLAAAGGGLRRGRRDSRSADRRRSRTDRWRSVLAYLCEINRRRPLRRHQTPMRVLLRKARRGRGTAMQLEIRTGIRLVSRARLHPTLTWR